MADAIKIPITAKDNTKAAFRSVNRNIDGTTKAAMALSRAFGPIAAFASAGSLLAIGKQAINSADQIQKMSKRLDISTEALSQYRHVAKLSGTDFEQLAKAISRSQRVVADAEDGLKTAERAITDMGLSVAELKRLSPEDAFERMGAAMAAIEDPFTRASVAMNVFGRGGREIIPMFADGADAVRAMREEADRLGLTLSQDMADAAAAAADATTRLNASWEGFTQTLATGAAPAVTALLNALSGIDPQVGKDLSDLRKEISPEAWSAIVDATKNYKDGVDELRLAMVKAQIVGDKFRSGDGLFANDRSAVKQFGSGVDVTSGKLVELAESGAAANAAVKNFDSALTESDGAVAFFQSLEMAAVVWRDVEAATNSATGAANAYAAAIGPGLDSAEVKAGDVAQALGGLGVDAANGFGDAIVDAAMRGGSALEAMNSILYRTLSGLISFGIGALFNPVSILSSGSGSAADFIGPLQGASAAADKSSGVSVGSINVSGSYNMSGDPLAKRKIAEGIFDELRKVSRQRGAGGGL